MFYILIIVVTCLLNLPMYGDNRLDLTLVGGMSYGESLDGIAGHIIKAVSGKVKVNFIPTRAINPDLPAWLSDIVFHSPKAFGKVTILTDSIWRLDSVPSDYLNTENTIKIAYSMHETTQLPPLWVTILNNKFDAVVVPEKWLVELYTKCGVKIPIFTLPLIVHLEDFLQRPLKLKSNRPFVFGSTGHLTLRKNFLTLINAFIAEFGNNPHVILKIHSRGWDEVIKHSLRKKIEEEKIKNIEIITQRLNRKEYIDFISSLDCYVLLSRGEGFSITPREALALGMPCILTNNTSQSPICSTGLVKSIKSDTLEVPFYGLFERGNERLGWWFGCEMSAVRSALSDMYTNYTFYLQQNSQRREWVKQYLSSSLQRRYLTLVSPQNLILGKQNSITDSYLMTNSQELYQKYKKLVIK